MQHVKRGLVVLTMSVLLLGMAAIAASYQHFQDVPDNAPYAHEINALKEAGIFTGDSSGNFLPNNTMKRAEAATLLVRLFIGEPDTQNVTNSFSDVPSSHWAFGYIETAVSYGMISGYGSGEFGPGDDLTYEQAVTLLVRALGYDDMAQERGGWPHGYITAGNELGMTQDTVNLAGNPVPRDVVAKLIYNAWYEDYANGQFVPNVPGESDDYEGGFDGYEED